MTFPVFCTASTQMIGDNIIARLKNSGFHADNVSSLFPTDPLIEEWTHEQDVRASSGTTLGATVGGVVDGALGLLPGMDFPAAVGAIAGALSGMGVPETQAQLYAGRVKEGRILISVHAPTHEDSVRARQIFLSEHASDISTGYEASVSKARASDFDYRARASSRDNSGSRQTF